MGELQERLARLPFASVVATMFAAVAVILVAVAPQLAFERAFVGSGLSALTPAANPPLGDFARILAMLAAAMIAGTMAFAVALLIDRTVFSAPVRDVRRDAAMPSGDDLAFPRGPLFADRELGAPLMSDEAFEHARDELILDAPLIDGEAAEPSAEAEPELEPVTAADNNGDRPGSERPAATLPSLESLPIAALMARLEAGIAARPDGMPPLASLRKLSVRA